MTIYAIIAVHGHQIHVQIGRFYRLRGMRVLPSQELGTLPYRMYRVLMLRGMVQCLFGQPWVYGAVLDAHCSAGYRNHRITIYKMKPKKKMRRKLGYRHAQHQWQVRHIDIASSRVGV